VTGGARGFRDELDVLRRDGQLKLDLGCGTTKRDASYVGVDVLAAPGVDVVGDAMEVLRALPDDRVEEIYSSHFLEHVDDLPSLVREVARVLVVGGRCTGAVPHFSNPYYHSDPTHRRPFGLYTLSYLAEDPLLRRRVPTYGLDLRLRVERLELGFRSATEFPLRSRGKQALGRLLNGRRAIQEFYEENLAWLIPCYEVRFELRKVR
jgi:SAM-dependent methyltransferase